jgi:ESS family glutamate:Na+ symporter
MDFSAANTSLWDPIIQIGVIAGLILLANVLRRKIAFVRKSLIPTAVLAGFLLLFIRTSGIININAVMLEKLTYHALALGFICMSLRIPEKNSDSGAMIGSKSGALIVATYLVQALTGLVVSLGLAYTIMPDFFKASGILLPMAYGQGPGQANNVGTTYEALGMTSGRTFGLSLAATGYLCACVVGVVFLNLYNRKNKLERIRDKEEVSGSVTIDTFQNNDEIPISESVDKLSIQFALVALVYLLTYWLTRGISNLITMVAPGAAGTVSTLLWGFNFIIGSMVAVLCRTVFKQLRSKKIMMHQYQNNYLLSRMSGLAFDLMIVAGIAGINIDDLSGYWLPFILMAVLGAIVTYFYLIYMCKKLYPDYAYEGFFSMYGMLTGTISSGVLLLREIDPNFETPAANNLVTGSSFGIVFGAPVLLLVSYAPQDVWMTSLLIVIYLIALTLFMFKVGKKTKK